MSQKVNSSRREIQTRKANRGFCFSVPSTHPLGEAYDLQLYSMTGYRRCFPTRTEDNT